MGEVLYTHKSFLVSYEEIGDNKVELTDQYGQKQILWKEQFEDRYTPVQKVKPVRRRPQLSPFEIEMYAERAKGYTVLQSNIESDEYINGTKLLSDVNN